MQSGNGSIRSILKSVMQKVPCRCPAKRDHRRSDRRLESNIHCVIRNCMVMKSRSPIHLLRLQRPPREHWLLIRRSRKDKTDRAYYVVRACCDKLGEISLASLDGAGPSMSVSNLPWARGARSLRGAQLAWSDQPAQLLSIPSQPTCSARGWTAHVCPIRTTAGQVDPTSGAVHLGLTSDLRAPPHWECRNHRHRARGSAARAEHR